MRWNLDLNINQHCNANAAPQRRSGPRAGGEGKGGGENENGRKTEAKRGPAGYVWYNIAHPSDERICGVFENVQIDVDAN